MKYKITVSRDGEHRTISANGGDMLLHALREVGLEVYAPCGGNGTCGKCKAWVEGEGAVTSCFYPVDRDLEVRLPGKRESQILVEQHQHTLKLPLQPGDCAALSDYPYGVAIDIGTTTIVFYLTDLITGVVREINAIPNPQAAYGSDVIARINYTAENAGGLQTLQQVLVNGINQAIGKMADDSHISQDDIVKLSMAGNTTMLHLLAGVDPLSIALAPFTPTFLNRQVLDPAKLGLHCHKAALVETLPGISAYVGADIVAGLASLAPGDTCRKYLFMDIGTNGELALVTPDGLLCCATAAGPAFEGARISCGMTATEGAVSAFDADGAKVIGDEPAIGICGSGLIDIVAHLLSTGVLDAEGTMEQDFEVVPAGQTGTGQPLMITQQDIREVQLAKSAIAAGVTILLNKAGIAPSELDAVFLAGGFGNFINVDNAMRIGLLSPAFSGKIISLGNTSGTGALLALKSLKFHENMKAVCDRAKHLELAEVEDFAMEFAMNMMFDQSLFLV